MKRITFLLILFVTSCGGGSDSTSTSTTTSTTPPAPTASLKSSANAVFPDQPFTVTWSSTNATSCNGNWSSWTGTAVSGSQMTMSNQPGTDALMITCGTANASVNVTINPMPSTVPAPDLTANQSSTALTGATSSATWSITDQGTDGTFNGAAAMYSVHTLTVNGTADAVNQFYTTNPFTAVGSVDTTTNITGIYSNYVAMPAMLANGDSGALYSINYFDSMGNAIGTGTMQWQFAANNVCSYQLILTEDDNINGNFTQQEWQFGVLWNGTLGLINYNSTATGQLASTWGC